MAEPISYEQDIAPLKQRYFQSVTANPRLRPEFALGLSQRVSQFADKAYEQQLRFAEAESSLRSRQLQYESALFSLEREREKAARERTMLQELAPLQKELDSILSDPEADTYTKQQELGRIGVRNAGLFAINPAAETAYRAAQMGIVKPPKQSLTVANYLQAGGAYEQLQDYESKLGRPLEPEDQLPVSVYGGSLQSTRQLAAKQAELSKLQKEQQEEAKKSVSELVSFVNKAKLATTKTLTGEVEDPNTFDTPMSQAAVDGLIQSFGTAEERSKLAEANAKERLSIAQKISADYLLGKRKPAAQQAQPIRSLFGIPQ